MFEEIRANTLSTCSDDPGTCLKQLQDHEELRELVARYSVLISTAVSPINLFVRRGLFRLRAPDTADVEVIGIDQLRAFYDQTVGGENRSYPIISSQIVSLVCDRASGISCLTLKAKRGDGNWEGAGYYEDQFERESGRWLFSARECTLLSWDKV